SRRMDSAWTVMSAVMAPDSIEARRSGLGSGYDAIVDAVGAIGGHEPQPVAAGIVRLGPHRPVSAAGRQCSIERPGPIGRRRRACGDTRGIGLIVGIRGRGRTERGT